MNDSAQSRLNCDQTHQIESPVKFIFARLSTLMLAEFFVFGAWFATLGLVLFTVGQSSIIGYAYMLCAVAAIVSPLTLGAISDRFISSEKILALLHIIGGGIQLALPSVIASGNSNKILLVIFLYMFCFQPTLGLVNSLSFENLKGKPNAFPFLRVFATGGWVLAGLFIGWLGYSSSTGIFTVAGISSILLGLYSFTLPCATPAAKVANEKSSLWDAMGGQSFKLFRNRSFSVLMICALLTSISLGFYNTFASNFIGALGIQNVAGVLSLGQLSEVIFIISVPFVINHIGMKWSLLIGMMMWGLRFVLFIMSANGYSQTNAIVGVALHGICNDFFLIISAMYIDRLAPVSLKAQAQSWLIIMISGFGAVFGSGIAGSVYGSTVKTDSVATWTSLWMIPIGIAIVTSIIWVIGFKENKSEIID
ncbi:MFS transporter [uncultured Tolumonas sp.]|uniref:MFS transporter n=1 Tax=uncultured Tolumonas sp. TaxID=263765 RepID=UPI00292D4BC7|nr:MFS transporter [uncultured Tolumonas sp.]